MTWTIDSVVRWASDDFRTRGIESPRLDAEVLLAFALQLDRVRLIVEAQKPLSPDELARFRDLVKRRRRHEPVAYLRGFREFYGRSFKVDARVLIPRPDTEILVQTALDRTAHISLSARALDLCTGSGCVGITLARERPTTRVVATDLSADALAVARDNAYRLGAYNAAFAEGDLFQALATLPPRLQHFDLVTANPPYIQSAEIETLSPDIREFEPRLALDGGGDGLSLVRRIVDEAPAALRPGGVLAMEIGDGEADATRAAFEARGFTDVEVTRDYARIERVVSGVWPRR
jgi:release factor glutamine methyltransferase